MPNEEQKYHLGWLVLILIIGVAIGYIAFGNSGITGQVTAGKQTTTVTKIISPAYGSNFKQGETFTIQASISCSGKRCNSIKSMITFNPASGVRLPNSDATHSMGTMLNGETKLTSWLVSGASKGAYTVTVTTTSLSASKSNDLISINVYVPICNAHSDCGTSGYVGPNYCIDKGVYKDYVTHTCNLAGTVNAYCTSSTTPIIQEACSYACSNGQCTNAPSCSTDSDCPGNGDVSAPFCLNGNLYAINFPRIGASIATGGQAVIDINGVNVTVALLGVNTQGLVLTATLSVNGETQSLTEGQFIILGGQPVYVIDITSNPTPVGSGSVVIQIGAYSNGKCFGQGTPNSYCGLLNQTKLAFYCDYGCSNGACNPTTSNSCSDTDGGISLYTAGTVSGYLNSNSYSYTDKCFRTYADDYINEYYCNSTVPVSYTSKCPYGCINGACDRQVCVDDDKDGYNAFMRLLGGTKVYRNDAFRLRTACSGITYDRYLQLTSLTNTTLQSKITLRDLASGGTSQDWSWTPGVGEGMGTIAYDGCTSTFYVYMGSTTNIQDGYITVSNALTADRWTYCTTGNDCDDTNPNIYPGHGC